VRLKEYISKDLIFSLRGSVDKAAFLKDLTTCIKEQFPSIDEGKLLTNLTDRENQATTGIGHGVAIPHTTSAGIEKTVCVIALSPGGVDFESIDSAPVHLTFLLLSPSGNVGNHLRILARIARLVSREDLVSNVLAAENEAEVYTVLEKEDDRHV
jgi:PTS system nitrogen regulatory IIA component